MIMAVEQAEQSPEPCVHRTRFDDRNTARAEARRMSRNLGAHISPFYCNNCEKWYVGASHERGVFDKTDLEIIKCLVIGLRDRDMANHLGVQEFYVRKRVSNMFERTETNSRAQLVAFALYNGVVDYGALMEGKPRAKK